MPVLVLLSGAPMLDEGEAPPEPEEEVTPSGGGPIGGRALLRRRIDLALWEYSARVEEEEYTLIK